MSCPLPIVEPKCSVVIATLDRVDSLMVVLDCLDRQTQPPLEIIIAVAGDPPALVAALAQRPSGPAPIRLLPCPEKSAGRQRNAAAALATGDVLAFLDDDIEFSPTLLAEVLPHFSATFPPALGALSPRIAGTDSPPPGRITRWYYRCQAGYTHADYGGRLFGVGINRLPAFASGAPLLVPVEWLPSTCLFIRADIFHRLKFPDFTGYSFAEDVHLTARVAREAPLYFQREPAIIHHSLPSEFKSDHTRLMAGKLHNMARVAREAMGLSGWSLGWRWHLHRLFLATLLLLRRPPHWRAELAGIRQARL
jgi:glycosyltransferase involved in cell wall biosynthesis